MFVHVDFREVPPTVTLRDPDDCARFHVAATGPCDEAALGSALRDAGAGALVGGAAFVASAWVAAQAAGRVADGWGESFEGMTAYARSRGWLDESEQAIRAHIEWSQP